MEFAVKFPYARDRAIEMYFWIFAIYFEPQYSLGREMVTKVLAVISLIDDTYDAHGTYEELIPFTEAIKRLSIQAFVSLNLVKILLDPRLLLNLSSISLSTSLGENNDAISYPLSL